MQQRCTCDVVLPSPGEVTVWKATKESFQPPHFSALRSLTLSKEVQNRHTKVILQTLCYRSFKWIFLSFMIMPLTLSRLLPACLKTVIQHRENLLPTLLANNYSTLLGSRVPRAHPRRVNRREVRSPPPSSLSLSPSLSVSSFNFGGVEGSKAAAAYVCCVRTRRRQHTRLVFESWRLPPPPPDACFSLAVR